jgi:hypothetical protein
MSHGMTEGTIYKLNNGDTANSALRLGAGNSNEPETTGSADSNFIDYRLKSTAASGTNRGMYIRQYLTGGAGGEAARIYNTVSSNTPADTINGAHISQDFGSTAGNVTGEGQAVRATLMVPNRTLGGTCAAVKAELWADGASSDASNVAFIRCTLAGNSTGVTTLDTSAKFMTIDGVGAAGAGKILQANTAGASTNILKISVDGVAYGIMLVAL